MPKELPSNKSVKWLESKLECVKLSNYRISCKGLAMSQNDAAHHKQVNSLDGMMLITNDEPVLMICEKQHR